MRVGFVGLGKMGAGMAANLQKVGVTLVVHDLNRAAAQRHVAAGAVWADSPRDAATGSDIVFTSLPAPPDVETVALGERGLLAGMVPGSAYFDLSTNGVATVRRIHAAFGARGVDMLDAPVSGGAATGKLAIWVGGAEPVYRQHKKLLDAMGDQARYIGPIGAGTVAKLVHNCASATIACVLAEVFTMGIKAGVEPLALWEAVRQGATGRRRTFDRLAGQFLPGKYDTPDFTLRLIHKDVTLATELGAELGVPMRLANHARDELNAALARGWGERASQVAMTLQEERAGIAPLAVDPARIQAILDSDGTK